MDERDLQRFEVTISDGLLPSEEWPPDLQKRLENIRQGDVVDALDVGRLSLIYHACPSAPVWERTLDYSEEEEPALVVLTDPGSSPRYFVITTQTCDIVESGRDSNHPWVQVAPVFDMSRLSGGERKMLVRRGFNHWLWHLPGLEAGFWVADLRIEFPVEKGLLGTLPILAGHSDESDRRRFGERLATRRSRPAFADVFCDEVQKPLVDLLRQLKQSDEEVWAEMQAVDVFVRMDDHLNPSTVQVAIISDEDPPQSVKDWWTTWWADAAVRALEVSIDLLPLQIVDSHHMSAWEYRQFVPLPLVRISPA
jgi:hypothetical protein